MSTGEGATSEGEFWESLNSACLGRVPVIFLIEDNGYAISVPVADQTPGVFQGRLILGRGYDGLVTVELDGCDVAASFEVILQPTAIERARKGEGPTLIVADVVRPCCPLVVGRSAQVHRPEGDLARDKAPPRSDSRAEEAADPERKTPQTAAPAPRPTLDQKAVCRDAAAERAEAAPNPSPRLSAREVGALRGSPSPRPDPPPPRSLATASCSSTPSTARSPRRWRARTRCLWCSAKTSLAKRRRLHRHPRPHREARRRLLLQLAPRREPPSSSASLASASRCAATSRCPRFILATTCGLP